MIRPASVRLLAAARRDGGGLCARTRGFSSSETMNVFDRNMKREQRNAAANRADAGTFDYLKDEVARRLVDRILDISKKEFPVCVDLGCGTGHIGKFLGGKGGVKTLINTELSPDMLKRNINKPHLINPDIGEPVPASRNTFHVVADEEFVPFPPSSLDLVLSSMSLHWVNDVPNCLEQVRRSLRPDGVFIGAMLGGETLQELRSALALADMERNGGVRPHLSPFVQVRDCADLLTSAGFNLPTVDKQTLTVKYPDMFTLMEHLQAMAEQNAPVLHSSIDRDTLIAAASIYEQMYGNHEGVLDATFQVVYMIGWAPHESQPKPNQRGTGENRLTDLDQLLTDEKDKEP